MIRVRLLTDQELVAVANQQYSLEEIDALRIIEKASGILKDGLSL